MIVLLSAGLAACTGTKKSGETAATGAAARVNATTSLVTADSAPILADGTAAANILVTLLDADSVAVEGVQPQVTASGSLNTLGACTLSDVDGVSTCTLSSTSAEDKVITLSWPVEVAGPTLTFHPGAAEKLCFAVQPGGGTAGVVWARQPKVTVADANCNAVTTATDSITLSLTSGTGAISGAATMNAVSGVAEFTDLSVDFSGSDKKITAAASGMTSAESTVFNIAHGTGVTLAFTTQPGGGTAGVAWSQQPKISLLDAFGNLVSTNSAMYLTLALTPGAGTLSGNYFRKLSAGVATFTDLNVDQSGTGKELFAVCTAGCGEASPSNATSAPFSVSPGPANKLSFLLSPTAGTAGVAFFPQPIVVVQDSLGNTVDQSAASVSLTIATGTGTLAGSTTLSATSGTVSFANLLTTAAGAKEITASSGTLTTATTSAFSVGPNAVVTGSTVAVSPSAVFADGSSTITVTALLKDTYGNPVPDKSVSLVSSRSSLDTISGSPATSDSNGLVTFTVKSSAAGSSTLTVTDNTDSITLSTAPTVTFSSTTSAIAQSDWSTAPVSTVANGTNSSLIRVVVRNSSSLALAGKTVSVSSSRGGTDTITPSSGVTDASGLVEFGIKSSTRGVASLTISVTTDTLTLTNKARVSFLDVAPFAEWQAQFAKSSSSSMGPGVNSPATSAWKDLFNLGPYDGALTNFAYTTASGWCGDGTGSISACASGPYRLLFDGANDYVTFGTSLNSLADASYEAWVRPVTPAGRGKVILSNGDSSNRGLALRQSWDGTGRIEMTMGISLSVPGEIYADTPQAYYRLNESSGTLASAMSGGVSAVYQNVTLGQASGVTDNQTSVAFNGSSSYIDVGDNFDSTNDATVEAWVYPTDTSGTRPIVSKHSGTRGYALELVAGQLRFRVTNDAGTTHSVTGATSLSTNTWYHVVGVRNATAGTIRVFVNGIPDGTAAVSGTAGTSATFLYIGSNGSEFFAGNIDEVAIYSTPLGSTRIVAHTDAGQRATCYSQSTLSASAWSMIGATFDSATSAGRLYINGASECTQTFSGAAHAGSSNPLVLGASYDSVVVSGSPWNGHVGDVRVYNSVLTPTYMSQTYSVFSSKFP